jgi:hypothetical protein
VECFDTVVNEQACERVRVQRIGFWLDLRRGKQHIRCSNTGYGWCCTIFLSKSGSHCVEHIYSCFVLRDGFKLASFFHSIVLHFNTCCMGCHAPWTGLLSGASNPSILLFSTNSMSIPQCHSPVDHPPFPSNRPVCFLLLRSQPPDGVCTHIIQIHIVKPGPRINDTDGAPEG